MKSKEKVFRDYYAQYKDKLYRLCLGYTGNRADAQDLQQEILLRIWQHLDSFRGESRLSTWCYRIATNTALSYVRKHKRQQDKQQPMLADLASLHDHQTPPSLEQEEASQRLYKAIAGLKETDRLIIGLLLEGCSYKEIAHITGLSLSNTGVRINRIKNQLSEKLTKNEG